MIKIERAEKARTDNYSFTLTDKNGVRVYGICLRGLDAGAGLRFDVHRRVRRCFCIISRHPYFSLFRNILREAHGLSLLRSGSERVFLEQIFRSPLPAPGDPIVIPCTAANKMFRQLSYVTPIRSNQFHRETPIVPLVQALGVEQFLLVLSAALCERRLMFVADDVGTLSTAVHAAAAMLHPFQWQHVFIPLLPSKLLSYAAAPVPYMIGVRRYLLPMLFKEAIDDMLLIDLDSGECTIHGKVIVKDFIGSAGTVMKQAAESLDRVKAGMMKAGMQLFSGSSLASPATKGAAVGSSDRDLAACMLADLRAGMARKPGATGAQAALMRIGKTAADGSKERYCLI